jgi:hypothetical protein
MRSIIPATAEPNTDLPAAAGNQKKCERKAFPGYRKRNLARPEKPECESVRTDASTWEKSFARFHWSFPEVSQAMAHKALERTRTLSYSCLNKSSQPSRFLEALEHAKKLRALRLVRLRASCLAAACTFYGRAHAGRAGARAPGCVPAWRGQFTGKSRHGNCF